MTKNPYLIMVEEFHRTFDHPVLTMPTIPENRKELRINLLREELSELSDAVDEGNINDVADAFADLQYVLAGAIIEFGLAERFDKIFAEVHRSNMSKACKTEQEAIETQKHYKEKLATETYYVHRDGFWFVYRKSDDKTLKSVNYSPANLTPILHE